MRTNVKAKPTERTNEGAPAISVSPIKELRRSLMACMLWESGFYESGEDQAARMAGLIKRCSFNDAAQAAIDAREKFKLRHAPLFVVRELIRNHNGRKVGDLIARVIQRPDELGELLTLYWKDNPQAPLASQLKIGLARALKKFSAYQLAKWNQDGAVKLRDVLFLSHARPRGAADRYTAKERKKRAADFTLNEHELLFKQIVEGKLQAPDTWEVALSAGADKKQVFTRLINENKLGALALLRNLRGMIEAGVNEDVIRDGLFKMNTERVLPFRFITAARYAPRLEDALEQAMFKCLQEQPKLLGKTALLIDVSGSMKESLSANSELKRIDAAAGLAMLVREVAERARIFCFNVGTAELPPRRGFALRAEIPTPNNGTSLGQAVRKVYEAFPECARLIVLTDEQSMDRPQHPQGRGYIINVAGNKNGIAYGPWVSIDGWSEAVIDYIREAEAEEA
jgi:60 kDa SS-A/Ro ribonucleoprotein